MDKLSSFLLHQVNLSDIYLTRLGTEDIIFESNK